MFKKASSIAFILFFLAFLTLGLLLLGSLVPVAGGYQVRIVESGSMSPTIPLGSAIFLSPSDTYTIGDIVTFQRADEEEVTTHRIVGVENEAGDLQYTMQGDANNVPDMRPVEQRELVGKVWLHVPYLGFLLDFIRQPLGFVLLIGIPAAFIVYEQGQRVMAEVRKQQVAVSKENEQ